MLIPIPLFILIVTALQEYAHQCHADKEKATASDDMPHVEPSQAKEQEPGTSSTNTAKIHKSRKLISTCTNVEPWLLERFPLDSGEVVIAHVIHKTNMLPHFQIRLCSNATHDGKCSGGSVWNMFSIINRFSVTPRMLHFFFSSTRLHVKHFRSASLQERSSCSASYNPLLPKKDIDLKCNLAALVPAKERSMGQAFYMCWTWASDALKSAQKRRRVS